MAAYRTPVVHGVCCSCQSVAPVRVCPQSADYRELDDHELIQLLRDDVDMFVMADHDAFGKLCDGSGTVPQAVVRK